VKFYYIIKSLILTIINLMHFSQCHKRRIRCENESGVCVSLNDNDDSLSLAVLHLLFMLTL